MCRIEVVHVETEAVTYRTSAVAISFGGPAAVVPVVFRMRNCTFPFPGVYYVQIFHENKLIGERPLHLIARE